jgi:predicted PurR-regulated permease PerM
VTQDAPERRSGLSDIASTTVVVTGVVLALVVLVALIWIASRALIVIFGGVLLAVLLDAAARGLGYLTGWDRRLRLLLVFIAASSAVAAALWFGGLILAEQATSFLSAMQDLVARYETFVRNGGLDALPEGFSLVDMLPRGGTLLGEASFVATTASGAVTSLVVIAFLGGFFAWNPGIYKSIVLSLIPRPRRPRVAEVLDRAGDNMRGWLIGQSVSMLVIFAVSLVALMLIGMPNPILLSVQAGLLVFIPTLGPFVAGAVIILAGLSQSATLALWGLGTYLAIQFLESNLLTPIVQKRAIRLPPAATLGMQIIAGALFGLPGVIFAVPATAAGMTLIRELYVEDCLGGPWTPPDDKD